MPGYTHNVNVNVNRNRPSENTHTYQPPSPSTLLAHAHLREHRQQDKVQDEHRQVRIARCVVQRRERGIDGRSPGGGSGTQQGRDGT